MFFTEPNNLLSHYHGLIHFTISRTEELFWLVYIDMGIQTLSNRNFEYWNVQFFLWLTSRRLKWPSLDQRLEEVSNLLSPMPFWLFATGNHGENVKTFSIQYPINQCTCNELQISHLFTSLYKPSDFFNIASCCFRTVPCILLYPNGCSLIIWLH